MSSAHWQADSSERLINLFPAVYQELRRLASQQLARMPSGSTLQPTALVHEAWLRLNAAENASWQNRAHFLAAAAEAMRHILIDRARHRQALRHGGGQQRLRIEDIDIPIDTENDEGLLAINDAVEKLATEHPDVAALVQLRCFAGLEVSEAARALGIPRATAFRRWAFARTWLYNELLGR